MEMPIFIINLPPSLRAIVVGESKSFGGRPLEVDDPFLKHIMF